MISSNLTGTSMNIIKLFLLFIPLALSLNAYSLTIKIGVLTPGETNWGKEMKRMAKEVKRQTKRKVKLKFYFGGAQGDESDVLRKMRVGALQGGIFTGKTLGDINGDIRVMEIPFTFEGDSKKAWKSMETLTPYFNQKLNKSGFHNLGFFEIGMVYFISQKKTPNLKSLQGLKIWIWDGDEIASTMIKKMNLIAVPLPLPDVLGSLSTGIIQAAYAPPVGIVALQWNTKIKYLLDFPIAYSIGSFLINHKTWKKISEPHKTLINKLAKKYLKKVNIVNAKDNENALKAIKNSDVTFLKFPPKDQQKSKKLNLEIKNQLENKLFSSEALIKLQKTL